MTDNTYNGWSNRATWNVNLWLSNEEGLYHEINRIGRRYDDPNDEDEVEAFADKIKAFCAEIWEDGKTPDGDALRDADFEEIAKAWLED